MSCVLPILLCCIMEAAMADNDHNPIYVSARGNDAWSGRAPEPAAAGADGPFLTLAKAAAVAGPGDTVILRGGVYRETLKPARSGADGNPIAFRNYEGETPVISGADPITGWRREAGPVWSAPVDWDLGHQNQVFSGDEMLTEARWPNNSGTLFQPTLATVEAGSENTLTDSALPGVETDLKGALLWCRGGSEWVFWSARVTAYDAASHTLTFNPPQRTWYTPRKGNAYALMGLRSMLDVPGEWWFDAAQQRLFLVPPGNADPAGIPIEMKRRIDAIDLSGMSHIRVAGIHFRAAGIRADADSSDILLERLCGEYVAHSYEKDVSATAGVILAGMRIEVRDCEFAYSSASVVSMGGEQGKIVNCFIRHGNYAAKWNGTLKLSGRKHVMAHNTVRHSGRDLVNIHGLTESVIEHNDLSEAGWLTSDLGMTYGHDTDFGNTEIRYNHVHDNRARSCAMGIYFDHLSHNAIVHHNIVWNTGGDPIRFNNPGYFNMVFNNTCWKSGGISTYDHVNRNDLFGCRYQNNIFNKPLSLPAHVAMSHNIIAADPGFTAPDKRDFSLKPDSTARGAAMPIPGIAIGQKPDAGALTFGEEPWRVGHDFGNPPPSPVLQPPRVAYMNLVKNPCFELGTLEGWEKTGAGNATLVKGNAWGVNWDNRSQSEPTGTSKFELRLGGGYDGVEQTVSGLRPGSKYVFSAWLKVSSPDEIVRIEVEGPQGPLAGAECNSQGWTRKVIEFAALSGMDEVVIRIEKTLAGTGYAWCDNIGLALK